MDCARECPIGHLHFHMSNGKIRTPVKQRNGRRNKSRWPSCGKQGPSSLSEQRDLLQEPALPPTLLGACVLGAQSSSSVQLCALDQNAVSKRWRKEKRREQGGEGGKDGGRQGEWFLKSAGRSIGGSGNHGRLPASRGSG